MKFKKQTGKVERTYATEKVAFVTLSFEGDKYPARVPFTIFGKENISAVKGLEKGDTVAVSGTVREGKNKEGNYVLQAYVDSIEFVSSAQSDDDGVPF